MTALGDCVEHGFPRVDVVFPVAPALVVLGVPVELPPEDPVEVPLEDVVELAEPCAVVPLTPVEPDMLALELAHGAAPAPASVVAGIGVL